MVNSFWPLAALIGPALAVVQPADTVILGPYGNVPPVYPSRTFSWTSYWKDLWQN